MKNMIDDLGSTPINHSHHATKLAPTTPTHVFELANVAYVNPAIFLRSLNQTDLRSDHIRSKSYQITVEHLGDQI